jgi:hypothetical protein
LRNGLAGNTVSARAGPTMLTRIAAQACCMAARDVRSGAGRPAGAP